jgi:hypothetical protein
MSLIASKLLRANAPIARAPKQLQSWLSVAFSKGKFQRAVLLEMAFPNSAFPSDSPDAVTVPVDHSRLR